MHGPILLKYFFFLREILFFFLKNLTAEDSTLKRWGQMQALDRWNWVAYIEPKTFRHHIMSWNIFNINDAVFSDYLQPSSTIRWCAYLCHVLVLGTSLLQRLVGGLVVSQGACASVQQVFGCCRVPHVVPQRVTQLQVLVRCHAALQFLDTYPKMHAPQIFPVMHYFQLWYYTAFLLLEASHEIIVHWETYPEKLKLWTQWGISVVYIYFMKKFC